MDAPTSSSFDRNRMQLRVVPGELIVARLDPSAPLPDWADPAAPGASAAPIHAIIRTSEELTVVSGAVPPHVQPAERDFQAITITGQLDFSLIGILSGLAEVLARAGVSILALSTFDTDWILVRGDRLDDAIDALQAAGYQISR
ncbi:MAG: ACT domain-containing protein [Phycisphaerales bacterium]